MGVPRFTFADYDDGADLACSTCAWKGPGVECACRSWRDGVDVLCPSCDRTLASVGFPGVTASLSAELRRARLPDGRQLPQVPKGLCPWCGSLEREPYDDEWYCLHCRKSYPTGAHKCRRETCWEYVFLDDYCPRHDPYRARED